jgi:cob(I)alamin adenosyltransferase
MKVYTKTGDKGSTSLYDGTRVSKDYIRVESYGTIDELNSSLGLAKNYIEEAEIKELVSKLQRSLFDVAGELATSDYEKFKTRVTDEDIKYLEKQIDHFTSIMDQENCFILPGSNLSSGHLHVARTICRRAERRMITLKDLEPVSETVMKYVNRLSDTIYSIARFLESELTYIEFGKEHNY